MSVQANLFPPDGMTAQEQIPGLTYIPNFITPEQEADLITTIDKQPWLTDLKRRVQHYGYKYDYTARRVDASMKIGDMPKWLEDYCAELQSKGYLPLKPDQVIINEYQPGQGIAPHIDCVPCFEETITSISLGSSCMMEFAHSETNKKIPVLLEPRSLFILNGDARYLWKHGIAARKTDKYEGQIIQRDRRISLTFRNVIIG